MIIKEPAWGGVNQKDGSSAGIEELTAPELVQLPSARHSARHSAKQNTRHSEAKVNDDFLVIQSWTGCRYLYPVRELVCASNLGFLSLLPGKSFIHSVFCAKRSHCRNGKSGGCLSLRDFSGY